MKIQKLLLKALEKLNLEWLLLQAAEKLYHTLRRARHTLLAKLEAAIAVQEILKHPNGHLELSYTPPEPIIEHLQKHHATHTAEIHDYTDPDDPYPWTHHHLQLHHTHITISTRTKETKLTTIIHWQTPTTSKKPTHPR